MATNANVDPNQDLVTMEEFYSANARASIPAKSAEVISEMLASCPCFNGAARPVKNFGRRNYRKSYRNKHHSHSLRTSRSVPLMFQNGTDKERLIRSDLNKITLTNYDNIFKRMRFLDEAENIQFVLNNALEKSFNEPEHDMLYIRLIGDMFRHVDQESVKVAFNVVNDNIPTIDILIGEAMQPKRDPAKDYGGFCEVCKIKRRMIGRSRTYAGLIINRDISGFIDITPLELYETHEAAMKKIVDSCESEDDEDIDTGSGAETILESMQVLISKHDSLVDRFRVAMDDIGMERFPTNKCKFKILDILNVI